MNNGVRRVVCGMRCALCQPSLCCRSLSGGTSLPQGSDGWACGVGHEVCALPTAAFFDRRNEVKVVAKVGFAASGFLPFCLSPSGYNLTEEFNA